MTEESPQSVERQLQVLRTEHRDLDAVLSRISDDNAVDELQIRRLKKRKLHLKDTITKLESELLPDITA